MFDLSKTTPVGSQNGEHQRCEDGGAEQGARVEAPQTPRGMVCRTAGVSRGVPLPNKLEGLESKRIFSIFYGHRIVLTEGKMLNFLPPGAPFFQ